MKKAILIVLVLFALATPMMAATLYSDDTLQQQCYGSCGLDATNCHIDCWDSDDEAACNARCDSNEDSCKRGCDYFVTIFLINYIFGV